MQRVVGSLLPLLLRKLMITEIKIMEMRNMRVVRTKHLLISTMISLNKRGSRRN